MELFGYSIIQKIGHGAFADVYLVEKEKTLYALKCIFKCLDDPMELECQQMEPILHGFLNHPNICLLIETFETRDKLFLVLEYCPMDLYHLLHTNAVNPEMKRQWFIQICQAVAYLHGQGIYHRDLKPQNILIKDGHAILTDFGLGTMDEESMELGCGSVYYMPPDGYQSECLTYSTRGHDIWSLGIILINHFAGKAPWSKPSLSDAQFHFHLVQEHLIDSFQIMYGFSPALCQLLRRLFEVNPAKRPDALLIAEEMQEILLYAKPNITEQTAKSPPSPPVTPPGFHSLQ